MALGRWFWGGGRAGLQRCSPATVPVALSTSQALDASPTTIGQPPVSAVLVSTAQRSTDCKVPCWATGLLTLDTLFPGSQSLLVCCVPVLSLLFLGLLPI